MENVTVNDFLYLVLVVVLPLLARSGLDYLSAKISGCEKERAISAVVSAVGFVGQTFVESLKREGSFDTIAQQAALTKAKEAALNIMDMSARKWLDEAVEDIDEWLTVQIENAIKQSK